MNTILKKAEFTVRFAQESDCALIVDFIKQLAVYEKLEHECAVTESILYDSLFVKKQAQVLIGESDGIPVAFALFFYNFSTFLGKANMYLEDLFVKQAYRGRGYGKTLFECLAHIAVEQGCERLDWWCLDWNKNSIEFYKKMGAVPKSDWTVYRLEGNALKNLDYSDK